MGNVYDNYAMINRDVEYAKKLEQRHIKRRNETMSRKLCANIGWSVQDVEELVKELGEMVKEEPLANAVKAEDRNIRLQMAINKLGIRSNSRVFPFLMTAVKLVIQDREMVDLYQLALSDELICQKVAEAHNLTGEDANTKVYNLFVAMTLKISENLHTLFALKKMQKISAERAFCKWCEAPDNPQAYREYKLLWSASEEDLFSFGVSLSYITALVILIINYLRL